MKILRTLEELKTWRKTLPPHSRLGFVPTMGALHEGHGELFRRSMRDCEFTLGSIFVNPTQFVAGEDLDRYPRQLEQDLQYLRSLGSSPPVVFAPDVSELYPPHFSTYVIEESVSSPACGVFRPGHFRGVTTIVLKLFNLVQPDLAYFGQKDAQQVAVIERMVRDLHVPVRIVRVDTIREPDGLALSSRNRYLSSAERAKAAEIYKSFQKIDAAIACGITDAQELESIGRSHLENVGGFTIQYYEIRDRSDLTPIRQLSGEVLLTERALVIVAAKLGQTRLIDNWTLKA